MSNVPVPALKEILFGRQDGKVKQHSGNKVYHTFIAMRKDIYWGLKSPLEQMAFVQSVLETFHSKGF